MKTFEEVQNKMEDWEKECLMPMSVFMEYVEIGFFTPYDGVGDIHDGNDFITNGFEVSIFAFIEDKTKNMSVKEFIEKYPYVAWYNK